MASKSLIDITLEVTDTRGHCIQEEATSLDSGYLNIQEGSLGAFPGFSNSEQSV